MSTPDWIPQAPACPLCTHDGGRLIVRSAHWRVIAAEDAQHPAFYRVIWNAHRAEWTDLSATERAECMRVVDAVEAVLRAQLAPAKINLASLGNQVPHVHWHVIARFAWDSHFPDPIWAAARRTSDAQQVTALGLRLPAVEAALRAALGAV